MPIISPSIDALLSTYITTYTSNSFGNQTLYNMCAKGNITIHKELADEIWLIGRSYSASPERRFRNPSSTITPGRGTGDYFQHIANYIISRPAFAIILSKMKFLTPLKFNCSPSDFSCLCTSIQCVEEFNELVKEASKDYDAKYNPTITSPPTIYVNQISFCSKFLHFHMPENFFIIDRFTEEGAKQLFSTQCRKKCNLDTEEINSTVRKAFSDEMDNTFKNIPPCSITSADILDYKIHVMRSYALGVVLKRIESCYSITKTPLVTYPRLTDIIFQKVL